MKNKNNLLDKNSEYLECLICHNVYRHLGSHIYHRHKIKANKYKEMFGLNHKTSLITKDIYTKKSKHFQKHRNKYLNNFLKAGKKNYFKKGKVNVNGYFSSQKKRQILENLAQAKRRIKIGKCPVCKLIYFNLASHLYNKHNLIIAK